VQQSFVFEKKTKNQNLLSVWKKCVKKNVKFVFFRVCDHVGVFIITISFFSFNWFS